MLHSSLTSGHSIAERAGCRLEKGGAEDADLGRGGGWRGGAPRQCLREGCAARARGTVRPSGS
eukprot:485895-Rhodomonas_salina.1